MLAAVLRDFEQLVLDDVAVIGVGGIGLLCLMVARAAGAGRLLAIDSSPLARRNALQMGATHALDPAGEQGSQWPAPFLSSR